MYKDRTDFITNFRIVKPTAKSSFVWISVITKFVCIAPKQSMQNHQQKHANATMMRGGGTLRPHTISKERTVRHLLFQIYTMQVPIDGLAASPVVTRPPGPHIYSWVNRSNVSKFSNKQQSTHTRNQPHIFWLVSWCPCHLAILTHTW